MTHDELEFLLPAPVSQEKAMDAAVEQYGFCPDVIEQGPEEATVGALADVYLDDDRGPSGSEKRRWWSFGQSGDKLLQSM